MADLSSSGSIRTAQQTMLWMAAGFACFSGTINKQHLRIRWNDSLRKLFALAPTQILRGGPLLNHYVIAEDRQRLQQACDALITMSIPIDDIIHINVNGMSKQLRVVVKRVEQSQRVVGFLHVQESTDTSWPVVHVSNSRWQSVGRLTLLDEVAAAMAHELNQPLAAIATFAQAGERLLNLPEPRLEKARQVFAEVAQQALRAGDLIRHMRSLIKRNPPGETQLSVKELIEGFGSLAGPMARIHRVEFSVPTEFPTVSVLVDVIQMHQVLLILFQNALDAVIDHESKKSIAVTVEHRDSKIIIAITDSGKGISPSTVAKLFQPFFSTKETGTGLGLISARNILESYGSHLEYANLPNGGCKFWFSLIETPSG